MRKGEGGRETEKEKERKRERERDTHTQNVNTNYKATQIILTALQTLTLIWTSLESLSSASPPAVFWTSDLFPTTLEKHESSVRATDKQTQWSPRQKTVATVQKELWFLTLVVGGAGGCLQPKAEDE